MNHWWWDSHHESNQRIRMRIQNTKYNTQKIDTGKGVAETDWSLSMMSRLRPKWPGIQWRSSDPAFQRSRDPGIQRSSRSFDTLATPPVALRVENDLPKLSSGQSCQSDRPSSGNPAIQQALLYFAFHTLADPPYEMLSLHCQTLEIKFFPIQNSTEGFDAKINSGEVIAMIRHCKMWGSLNTFQLQIPPSTWFTTCHIFGI